MVEELIVKVTPVRNDDCNKAMKLGKAAASFEVRAKRNRN